MKPELLLWLILFVVGIILAMKRRRRWVEYDTYINSAKWREVRRRFLVSGKPVNCYVCRARYNPSFHLHHRSYASFGREKLAHLVMVCSDCHAAIHRFEKIGGMSLWDATEYAKDSYRGHLNVSLQQARDYGSLKTRKPVKAVKHNSVKLR